MRMRAHVDRHAGEIGVEVGTMIEVEAPEEILIRFTGATVLGNDHAWNVFEHFARTQDRTVVDQLRRDHPCACCIRGPDAVFIVTGDHDRFVLRDIVGAGHAGRGQRKGQRGENNEYGMVKGGSHLRRVRKIHGSTYYATRTGPDASEVTPDGG